MDFEIKDGVLVKYTGNDAKVVIPTGVTCIGTKAFELCRNLTKITIPEGVKKIGSCAFSHCYCLTSIAIPDGVRSLENAVFMDCYSLTSITIPNSVTSLGNSVFYECTHLVDITIPDSVTSIGDSIFRGCSRLTNITIPDGVSRIGKKAFRRCEKLTNIALPDSVISIGDAAFSGCSSLTSIALPDSVMSIGNAAFNGCSSLTSIAIPGSVMSIGDAAFSECYSLANIVVRNSVAYPKTVNNEFLDPLAEQLKELYVLDPAVLKDRHLVILAILGFAKEEQTDMAAERVWKHFVYIRKNRIRLKNEFLKYPEIIRLICRERLFWPDEIPLYMKDAYAEGKALLEEYWREMRGFPDIVKMAKDIVRSDSDISGMSAVLIGEELAEKKDIYRKYLEVHGARLAENVDEETTYIVRDDTTWVNDDVITAMRLRIPVLSIKEFEHRTAMRYRKKAVITVPDWVRQILPDAFGGNGTTVCVELPAGVTDIAGDVFGRMSKLQTINVHPDNPAYQSEQGMLLSRDGKTLLYIPNAIGKTVRIPEGIEQISEFVFGEGSEVETLYLPTTLREFPVMDIRFPYGMTLCIPVELQALFRSAAEKKGLKITLLIPCPDDPSAKRLEFSQELAEEMYKKWFVQGADMQAERWLEWTSDLRFSGALHTLVWQAGNARFIIRRGRPEGVNGTSIVIAGRVSLAHPVTMDADEILYWRRVLKQMGVEQPFRQMWEPIVLKDSKLQGVVRNIKSADESFAMNMRYDGMVLSQSAIADSEGFRYIEHRDYYSERVERVNIITPAGILYACKPKATGMQLNGFKLYNGVRLRTLNHVAVILEEAMLEQLSDGEMLLPHALTMPEKPFANLRKKLMKNAPMRQVLESILEQREASPC